MKKYEKWINKKQEAIRKALEESKNKKIIEERTEKELEELVNILAKKYQEELKVRIEKIFYRKMKTKWASYSRNKNLTINTMAKHLPEPLIEYVVYHEVVHSLQRNHNENFWSLVSKKFPDYETKEKDLLTYWFIIQNKKQGASPEGRGS
ncbi:MAG: M48 family metallopeptidase [Candidatus Bathyarchaeia archaeon]